MAINIFNKKEIITPAKPDKKGCLLIKFNK